MTQTIEDAKTTWQKIVAGVKGSISKAEEELDDAGIERKALDITPDVVDSMRENLCAAFPAMCEGDGEVVADVMQTIMDTLADVQPSSDVAEERAEGDSEDVEEEDEEKDSEVVALTQQVADMGKEYIETINDMSDVVKALHTAYQKQGTQIKSNNDLVARLAEVEKKMGERPRRASQSPETTLDPKSKLANDIKERDLTDVPTAFADMFGGGNNA